RANGRPTLTIAARVSFHLRDLGVAEVASAEAWLGDESLWGRAPVKGAADVVVVVGEPQVPPKSRRLAGVAVARGTDVLWSKRQVASGCAGEPPWTLLDRGVGGFGARGAGVPLEPIGDDDDLSPLSGAASDQRLAFLRGGEQLLIVGFDERD